jgi:hypothetical protein
VEEEEEALLALEEDRGAILRRRPAIEVSSSNVLVGTSVHGDARAR